MLGEGASAGWGELSWWEPSPAWTPNDMGGHLHLQRPTGGPYRACARAKALKQQDIQETWRLEGTSGELWSNL